ncbi:MAG TPA: MBL fold metallo-hydrolase [Rhodoblastus sp.]|nr:MBL fold metallo-hydrolase [Rhodoblastus sp.]
MTTALTLIGGPTVLIEIDGVKLVTDPTFDPPGAYPSGAITLRKTRGPALSAAEIGAVDAVLLSHDQHADNLDPAGRAFLEQARTVFTTPVAQGRLGLGVVVTPFQDEILKGANGRRLIVTGAPARHGPPGIEPISGPVTGFLLGRDAPGDAVYVTGDTVWYEGVAEVARRYRPKIVVLFTGSAEPRGKFHMTMDANDALEAAHAFPEAAIVAVHNDGWAHFIESEAELRQAFAALGAGERLVALPPGEPVRFA